MFQVDHEINSYNSLIMNQPNKVNSKFSKTYSSSKVINSSELSVSKNKNQLLSEKKDNHNANSNCFNTDNTSNKNTKNITQKQSEEKEQTLKNVKKLPKILKYTIQTNNLLDSKCGNSNKNNNNRIISVSNPSDKLLKDDLNSNHNRRNLLLKEEFKEKFDRNELERKNSLRLSDTSNAECFKKILMPSDLIKSKKYRTKKEINFGKMKDYIKLPEFLGDEPLTEIIFNPIIDDCLTKPQSEKQYEINLYLNSHKMISNLIYLKVPLNKDGTIPIQNIINVKNIKRENKSEEDEEIIPEIQKEKSDPAPPADADEKIKLIVPKKRFISISEYPGNYNKPEKVIINERQMKFSQNMESKINSGYDFTDKMIQNENDNREIITLNRNEIYKKRANNSEIYLEKNDDIFLKDFSNIKDLKSSKNMNNLSSNIDNNMNEDIKTDDSNSNSNITNEKDKEIQLNTIYGETLPYYKLKDDKDKTLIFESRFESGNLLCAFRTDEENKYQLFLQNDTNTTGYIQWFFFRVSNTQKGRKVNFNIINMLRPICLYKKGLKIMTYSKLQAQNENIGWHRDCENIMYYTNNLFTYNENSKKKRSLSSLSFDYEFKYDDDKVYFANCLPYFYSKLIDEMEKYEKKLRNKFFFFKKIPFTQTLGGNDLILLNIRSTNNNTNINIHSTSSDLSLPQLNKSFNHSFINLLNSSNSFKSKQKELQKSKNKKVVFMIGRQHPGETVGSHVIKGCIDFLLGDSDEAKKLREIYDFQIVPMMNPDGVIVGNSRTGFAGCDLNRRWSKPNEIIHPEIYYTKSLILNTSTKQNISFVIDFHGHFGTYNSLFYCNHKENKKKCSLFPFLCSKLSNIISFQQSTFTMPKYKASTERLSLFRELEDCDNDNIIALETSFFGTYKGKEEKNYYFNSKLLNEIGRDVCLGMLSYHIKFENINIENNLNCGEDWEKMKKLDVDMRDFEAELIMEVNESDEEENKEELSESEPSIDNFDKKEILKLMPIVAQKKKKKKGKTVNNGAHNNNKIKKIEKYLTKRKYGLSNEKNNLDKNKNIDIDIELYNPLKELMAKKIEDENKKKAKPNKNTPIKFSPNIQTTKKPVNKPTRQIHTSNQSNNHNHNNNNQQIQPQKSTDEPKTKDEYTQTDEIFFRMHWTYFVGKYKILNCKRHFNNLPNITNAPFNMSKLNRNLFGRLFNKRNNFILINERFKNSDWTKFRNSQIEQNGNFNIIANFKNYNFKDKNVKPIYLNRLNRNGFSMNRNSSGQK